MNVNSKYIEYAISGGIFWVTILYLNVAFIFTAYDPTDESKSTIPPAVSTFLSYLEGNQNVINLSGTVELILIVLIIFLVFITGIFIDIISKVGAAYENEVSLYALLRNRSYIEKFYEKNDPEILHELKEVFKSTSNNTGYMDIHYERIFHRKNYNQKIKLLRSVEKYLYNFLVLSIEKDRLEIINDKIRLTSLLRSMFWAVLASQVFMEAYLNDLMYNEDFSYALIELSPYVFLAGLLYVVILITRNVFDYIETLVQFVFIETKKSSIYEIVKKNQKN